MPPATKRLHSATCVRHLGPLPGVNQLNGAQSIVEAHDRSELCRGLTGQVELHNEGMAQDLCWCLVCGGALRQAGRIWTLAWDCALTYGSQRDREHAVRDRRGIQAPAAPWRSTPSSSRCARCTFAARRNTRPRPSESPARHEGMHVDIAVILRSGSHLELPSSGPLLFTPSAMAYQVFNVAARTAAPTPGVLVLLVSRCPRATARAPVTLTALSAPPHVRKSKIESECVHAEQLGASGVHS